MSKLSIYDMKGAGQGELEVSDDLLILKKGEQAVHDAVVAHLAKKRVGGASTLGKGDVAGSNKKPWRQKGTGRARAGYRRSPIWRGGGVAFGPHPRSYEKKLSKNVRRLAFVRALSDKIAGGSVKVIDKLELSEPKTKLVVELLRALKIKGSVVIVLEKSDLNVMRAARNIPGVEVVSADSLDTYRIMKSSVVVATRGAMDRLRDRLQLVA
ncbi:MAG: 50S ribosomal protein L4 [bacterium]